MEELLFMYYKLVKLLVFVTLIHALFSLSLKNKSHFNLFLILAVAFATELIIPILKYNKLSANLFTNVSVIIHHGLWLLLLGKNVVFKKLYITLLMCFLAFSLINLFVITGFNNFNYYTFVIGAFLYITIFIYESFYHLRKETFSFFLSNNYLLLFSPILFFFGFSFMFAFGSSLLTGNFIIKDIMLYDVVMNFVNIIYYTVINIYIYREKRLRNAG